MPTCQDCFWSDGSALYDFSVTYCVIEGDYTAGSCPFWEHKGRKDPLTGELWPEVEPPNLIAGER